MYKITREQFLLRQPAFPDTEPSDPFYYDLANRLLSEALESEALKDFPDAIVGRAALCVIGYLQDVVADCGVWRSFINECRRLYGRTLPFFKVEDEYYVDYELNGADVHFLIWYSLCMYYEPARLISPLDKRFEIVSALWTSILSDAYDEAPVPEGYTRWRHAEMGDADDSSLILELANWLFMHNYLMTPAFALSLSEIVEQVGFKGEEQMAELQNRLEEAMHQQPTGPLALFIGEWVRMIISGKTLPEEEKTPAAEPHKFYRIFQEATNGEEIAFFDSYDSLNNFFINSMGWEKGVEHLPQMKNDHDFIILVNHDKGMLVARNIARCVAAPQNPLYDKEYAAKHAISLLTERGVCPADLLHYICSHGWLPDAVFPGTTDHALVRDNYDFIARCWLQQYYRGD